MEVVEQALEAIHESVIPPDPAPVPTQQSESPPLPTGRSEFSSPPALQSKTPSPLTRAATSSLVVHSTRSIAPDTPNRTKPHDTLSDDQTLRIAGKHPKATHDRKAKMVPEVVLTQRGASLPRWGSQGGRGTAATPDKTKRKREEDKLQPKKSKKSKIGVVIFDQSWANILEANDNSISCYNGPCFHQRQNPGPPCRSASRPAK